MLNVKQENCEYKFQVYGLAWLEIEPVFTISYSLFNGPLIACIQMQTFESVKCICPGYVCFILTPFLLFRFRMKWG